jgi:hypothetical protein
MQISSSFLLDFPCGLKDTLATGSHTRAPQILDVLPSGTIELIEFDWRHYLRIAALVCDVKDEDVTFAVAHCQFVTRRCYREGKAQPAKGDGSVFADACAPLLLRSGR